MLKELLPVSSPPPSQSTGSNSSSSRDTSAVVPQSKLPLTLEEPAPAGSGPNHLCATHKADTSSSDSDHEVDDVHSSFATHASNSRARTPQRQSPSSQAVAKTLSPAEAGKQAHVVERERDALLSSGLYHEDGENGAYLCDAQARIFFRARHSLPQIH